MNTSLSNVGDQQIDGLLSQFYKAQVPTPFPPARSNAPMPVRPISRSRTVGSKLSLAASVALLVGGCWYLSGVVTQPTGKANTGTGGSAKVPELLKVKDAKGR